jgi:hypothetical protein
MKTFILWLQIAANFGCGYFGCWFVIHHGQIYDLRTQLRAANETIRQDEGEINYYEGQLKLDDETAKRIEQSTNQYRFFIVTNDTNATEKLLEFYKRQLVLEDEALFHERSTEPTNR